VWPDTLQDILCDRDEKLLTYEVTGGVTKRLSDWGWIREIEADSVLDRLAEKPYPPRPDTSQKLENYLAYLEKSLNRWAPRNKLVASIPVRGGVVLFPRDEVIVLPTQNRLTDDEWSVVERVHLVDSQALLAIKEPKRNDDEDRMSHSSATNRLAGAFLSRVDAWDADSWETVLEKVLECVNKDSEPEVVIRLAHIASRFQVRVSENFQYLCSSGYYKCAASELLSIRTAQVERFLNGELVEECLLHPLYDSMVPEMHQESWERWKTDSEKSRLVPFPLPNIEIEEIYSERDFRDFCKRRCGDQLSDYPYKTYHFKISDFDFSSELWGAWEALETEDERVWVDLFQVLNEVWDRLSDRAQISAEQVSQQGSRSKLYWGAYSGKQHPRSAWLHKLAGKKCLIDESGNPAAPGDLMLSTPLNAYLQGIERFLNPEMQGATDDKFLLALGIRTDPDSGSTILHRIRALAAAPKPPVNELYQLYNALDRVFPRLKATEVNGTIHSFKHEKLLFAEGRWWLSPDVFHENPNDLPDCPTLTESLLGLRLWHELGVPREPNIEYALNWLSQLTIGKKPAPERLQRIKAILAREPVRVWEETKCWLDMSGKWASVDGFHWKIEKRPSFSLFDNVRSQIADFTFISGKLPEGGGCDALPRLESQIQQDVTDVVEISAVNPDWVNHLGFCLRRVKLVINKGKDSDETLGEETKRRIESWDSDRMQGERLAKTKSVRFSVLEVTPKISGQAVGEGHTPKVLWLGEKLYVHEGTRVLQRELEHELTATLRVDSIRSAVRACIERPKQWISDYFEQYFELAGEGESVDVVGERDAGEAVGGGPLEIGPEIVETQNDESPKGSENDRNEESEERKLEEKRRQPKKGITHKLEAEPFFLSLGYEWRPMTGIFTKQTGETIRKIEKGLFPWGYYDSEGKMKTVYWISGRSLENSISISAPAWEFFKGGDLKTIMVFPTEEGGYKGYTCPQLIQCIESGQVRMFPERYQLVVAED